MMPTFSGFERLGRLVSGGHRVEEGLALDACKETLHTQLQSLSAGCRVQARCPEPT
jgi:hypothetical protein